MAGLENILNKISSDSVANAEYVVYQAETEASEIISKAKAEAEKAAKEKLQNDKVNI